MATYPTGKPSEIFKGATLSEVTISGSVQVGGSPAKRRLLVYKNGNPDVVIGSGFSDS